MWETKQKKKEGESGEEGQVRGGEGGRRGKLNTERLNCNKYGQGNVEPCERDGAVWPQEIVRVERRRKKVSSVYKKVPRSLYNVRVIP